ncbi:helix-turn-helix transcriptional regulator [Corynebacteriaceae bacterium 7-707]
MDVNRSTECTESTVVPFRPRATVPGKLWREALGEEIRRQRTAQNDRLKDTAGRAGISAQYLSELERGMKDPSSEVLEAVAGALGKSSFELVRSAVAPTGPVLLAA